MSWFCVPLCGVFLLLCWCRLLAPPWRQFSCFSALESVCPDTPGGPTATRTPKTCPCHKGRRPRGTSEEVVERRSEGEIKALLNWRSSRDRNPSEFTTQPTGEEEGELVLFHVITARQTWEKVWRRKAPRDGGRERRCFSSPCRDLNMKCCEGERRRSVWNKMSSAAVLILQLFLLLLLLLRIHDPRGTAEPSWNTNSGSLFFCVSPQGNKPASYTINNLFNFCFAP